jgi:hypothetical protein
VDKVDTHIMQSSQCRIEGCRNHARPLGSVCEAHQKRMNRFGSHQEDRPLRVYTRRSLDGRSKESK